jgi:hypothetical protein
MPTINPHRSQDRINFILNRIRTGLSRSEVQRQFAQQYKTGRSQTFEWYNRALDSLIVIDPLESQRLRASIVEMYHTQIAGCQHDLASIQQEIVQVDDWWVLRHQLQEQLLTEKDKNKHTQLNWELNNVPKLTPITKANLIEFKCRVRDRLIKLFGELARIHGLFTEEMPWMRAVQVLLDNNLLPSQTAENILSTIQGLTANINSVNSTRVESNLDSAPGD